MCDKANKSFEWNLVKYPDWQLTFKCPSTTQQFGSWQLTNWQSSLFLPALKIPNQRVQVLFQPQQKNADLEEGSLREERQKGTWGKGANNLICLTKITLKFSLKHYCWTNNGLNHQSRFLRLTSRLPMYVITRHTWRQWCTSKSCIILYQTCNSDNYVLQVSEAEGKTTPSTSKVFIPPLGCT